MLYLVAVTYQPKKEKDEEEKLEELVIQPKAVVARDEKGAALKVAVDNSEMLKKYEHDRLRVYVRPF